MNAPCDAVILQGCAVHRLPPEGSEAPKVLLGFPCLVWLPGQSKPAKRWANWGPHPEDEPRPLIKAGTRIQYFPGEGGGQFDLEPAITGYYEPVCYGRVA